MKKAIVPKTASQLLNEMCVKAHTKAEYDYSTSNTFTATCTVKNFLGKSYTATGTGSTKKAAMQAASEVMIDQHLRNEISNPQVIDRALRRNSENAPTPSTSSNSGNISKIPTPSTSNAVLTPIRGPTSCQNAAIFSSIAKIQTPQNVPSVNFLPKAPAIQNDNHSVVENMEIDTPTEYAMKGIDPIADLNKFCEQYKLPTPEYKDFPMLGQSHQPIIRVQCKVGELAVIGTYRNKKLCKRIAVDKMLITLKRIKLDETKTFENFQTCNVQNSTKMQEEVEAEMNRTIAAAKNNPETADLFRSTQRKRFNFHQGSHFRSDQDKLRLQLKGLQKGPALQELTQQFPHSGTTTSEFKKWLDNRKAGGLDSFYCSLKKELKFDEKCILMKSQVQEGPKADLGIMASITLVIPKCARKPTAVSFGLTEEEALENARLNIIAYLAVAC